MEKRGESADLVVVPHQDAKESSPEPGLKSHLLAYNDKLFLAQPEMVKGWLGSVHSHPHEQEPALRISSPYQPSIIGA